jgi:hypothetical protein
MANCWAVCPLNSYGHQDHFTVGDTEVPTNKFCQVRGHR